MTEIARLEQQSDQPATSSVYPLSEPPRKARPQSQGLNLVKVPDGELSSYLPCHYFDYVSGTSSGGRVFLLPFVAHLC